jgi:hypothetical protein
MTASKKSIILYVVLTAAVLLIPIFLFSAVFGDYVDRKESISRNEATNAIDYPLVDSATNISYYWDVGGFQVSDFYMRVAVASRDITNQVNLAMAGNNPTNNRVLPYARTRIDSSEPIPGPSFHWWNKQIYWWTPDKITNGYFIRENTGARFIWVDENTGTLSLSANSD